MPGHVTLPAGTRLGPYEIVASLGAGGMGVVYKARDSRLDRFVALKTIHADAAESAEAVQRFEREARAISSLSHAHICALYDVGRADGVEYLVMELLEGQTLAARLDRGPVTIESALQIGCEIADALAAAHARGVVHRDLKPGNVMLTSAGVKLLDFGLARTFQPVVPGGAGEASTAAMPAALTEKGTLLGTAAYMAPEQIHGQVTDACSDVFSLGVLLYEMIAGRRAFQGNTTVAIAASILHQDPPAIASLRSDVPPALDRLVLACLVKDPGARWQTARDAAIELRGIADDRRHARGARAAADKRMPWLPWTIAAMSLLAAAFFWARPGRVPATPAAPLEMQLVRPPGKTFFRFVEGLTFALSPNGTRLAFIVRGPAGPPEVWIRSLTALDGKPVPGSEGALSLFWSADGQSVAWFTAGALKKVDAASGIAVTVCAVQASIGHAGTWSSTGRILFGSPEGNAIQSVSDRGGDVSTIVSADRARKELRVNFPWFLPDGKRFLYSARLEDGTNRLMIGADGTPSRVLGPVDSNAQFVAPNRLVFVVDGTLVTQEVDLAAGTLVGAPSPIADPVFFFLSTGVAAFAAASDGTVVYAPQRDREHLAWIDRTGKETDTVGTPGDYYEVRLAAGGRLALVSRALPATGTYDIWSLDLERGAETRLTLNNRTTEIAPVLMPDGRSLIYSGTLGGPPQLLQKNLETGVDVELLPRGSHFREAYDLTAGGTSLVYGERSDAGEQLWIWPLAGTSPPARLRESGSYAYEPRFSPDGKYYTFTSPESGRDEVYVAPVAGGSKQPVSAGGGSRARWTQDGREILYLSASGHVVSVPVSPSLQLGKPESLFALTGKGWNDFDVAPDGKRLLAIVRDISAAEEPLTARLRAIGGAGARR
jgi:hypothetical protein